MMQNEKYIKKIPCPQSAWSSGPSPLPEQGNSWPVRGAGCPAHALPREPGSAHAAGTASCYQHPTQEPRAPGHNCVRCYLQRGRRCEQGFPRDLLQPRVHSHQDNRSEREAASPPPYPGAGGGHGVFFGSRGERTACNLPSPGRASCLEQKRRRAKCLQTGARPEPPSLGQERQGEELLLHHLHSLRFFSQLPAGPGPQAVPLQSKCQR